MDRYKKINILLLVIVVSVATSAYFLWLGKCLSSCSIDLIDTWIAPLFYGGRALAVLLAVLTLFPGNIFKRWLQFIFSWGFPISIMLVAGIDIHSSNILNPSRDEMAELLGWFFGILTVIFIAAYYLTLWWKKRKAK
jgi:hypothetical protein